MIKFHQTQWHFRQFAWEISIFKSFFFINSLCVVSLQASTWNAGGESCFSNDLSFLHQSSSFGRFFENSPLESFQLMQISILFAPKIRQVSSSLQSKYKVLTELNFTPPHHLHTHTHTHPYVWHNGDRGSEKKSYFHKINSDYIFWFEFLEELLIISVAQSTNWKCFLSDTLSRIYDNEPAARLV